MSILYEGPCTFPECKETIDRSHNRKWCEFHSREMKINSMILYNGIRNPREREIIKCQMCPNLISNSNRRLTCSKKCRENKWWAIANIKKRKASLFRKKVQLRELEKKYANLL